jgi:hypothetical protein
VAEGGRKTWNLHTGVNSNLTPAIRTEIILIVACNIVPAGDEAKRIAALSKYNIVS